MQPLDGDELWRQIPPEEKIELLSQAHSAGVLSALIVILGGCSIAVGLKLPWFMWGSLIVGPLIFQFTAGRIWRDLRPRVMLQYLAARSALRRFAFTAKSKELNPQMVFRGTMEEVFSADQAQEELEATIEKTKEAEVWVALFEDAVVMIQEAPGGATSQFAQVFNASFKVEGKSPDGKEYSNLRELILSYNNKALGPRTVKLTSRYPAALVAFEKMLIPKVEAAKKRLEALGGTPELDEPPADEEMAEA